LQCCNTGNAIEDDSRFGVGWSLVFRKTEAQDVFFQEPAFSRLRRGNMDELIGQLASKAGIDTVVAEKKLVAEKAIGIMLGFLRSEGPSEQVEAFIGTIPGAEAAIAASNSGGGLARLMGGGVMATGTRLMSLGLGIAEIRNVARELFRYGRDKIGADQMGEIIAGTPGLSQLA
jgi:hypothetical protein